MLPYFHLAIQYGSVTSPLVGTKQFAQQVHCLRRYRRLVGKGLTSQRAEAISPHLHPAVQCGLVRTPNGGQLYAVVVSKTITTQMLTLVSDSAEGCSHAISPVLQLKACLKSGRGTI